MKISIVTLLTLAVVTAGSVAGQTDSDTGDMKTADFKQLFELFGNNGEDGGFGISTLIELFRGNGEGSGGVMDIIQNIMKIFKGRRGGGGVDAAEGDSGAEKMGRMRRPGGSRKGGLEPMFAIMGVLKNIKENMFGDDMDVSDPGKILLDIYGDICCVDNCTAKATTCMEAMKPPGNMSYYHEMCFPELMFAVAQGKNPMSVMGICVVTNIFKELELEYQPEDPKANAEAYLNKTASNLTGDAGQNMVDAVRDGTCVPPTIGKFQMKDLMKFKVCLMNTCVNAVVV